MSELTPSSMALFERLERSMTDPHVTAKMKQAKEYEQMINETGCSDKESAALANDLDENWAFKGATLKMTGMMWFVSPHTRTLHKQHVSGLEVWSQGFHFDPEKIELDGEYIDGLLRAAHIFTFDSDHPDYSGIVGMMHLDDVEHVDYPFPSLELRRQRFPINYPELVEEIDGAIMNANDDNDKIRRMWGFSLKIDCTKPEDVEILEDAQAYVDQIIGLDNNLPYYYLQVQGKLSVLKGEEGIINLEVDKQFRRIATVKRVSFHPDSMYESTEKIQRFVPCLDVTIHGREQEDSPQEAIVPFASVMWAESIRAAS